MDGKRVNQDLDLVGRKRIECGIRKTRNYADHPSEGFSLNEGSAHPEAFNYWVVSFGFPSFDIRSPAHAAIHGEVENPDSAELWVVPRPLPDIFIEHSAGRKFTYYGYQFETPWTELKQQKTSRAMQLFYFSNGFVVMFHDPGQSVDQLKVLTSKGSGNEAELKELFGKEATRSNYALRSKILYLTPRDLRLSFSRQKMVSNSVLLMLKPIWTGSLQGGLYSFQTEWLWGFQHGDPTKDKAIVIDAFDAHDHEIELSVGRGQDAAQTFSQSEINRIIYSLRPVSPSQTE
jgi:hypothetical protein